MQLAKVRLGADCGSDQDGEALYSQQKQDWELIVAQIKMEKPYTVSKSKTGS